MIVTVTLNPAYDVTYTVGEFLVGRAHRVTAVHERVGGKGFNVARVLAVRGVPVVAVTFGDDEFEAGAQALGFEVECVRGLNKIRRTLVVHDELGSTTSLWEPGHRVAAGAAEQLLSIVERRLPRTTGLVVAGSLARGVPADLPALLAQAAVRSGVPVIVDADDEALRLAAQVSGVVLMPNRDELARLAASPIGHLDSVMSAVTQLVADGAGAVVATLGESGMVAADASGAWRAALDQPIEGNPTGAGDAAVAAAIAHLAKGEPRWPELLLDAIATSASAVGAPVAGEIDLRVRDRLLSQVRVSELHGPPRSFA
ncbi:MAG: hexose kinase [Nocardioidaceae bacterium]|nr:hexose kinase [Nocardioidaceae bacterium]